MMIRRNTTGFTLVEIMIVVAIIGLLAAIAVPSFVQARSTSRKNTCKNNLRQIDQAKEQYAMDGNKVTGDAVTQANINTYLKAGAAPTEPQGGTYTINVVGTNPTCDQGSGHSIA